MKTSFYLVGAGLFIALVAVVLAAVLLGVRHAWGRAAATEKRLKLPAPWLIGAGLLAWLALAAGLAAAGTLANFDARPPRLLPLLALPLLVSVWLARSEAVGRVLDAMPRAGLVYLQSMRVLVELVLWLLFLAGLVPKQMTFEGLNWDVLTGLTAPVVAYCCFRRRRWPWQVAAAWNFAGLGLLLNIVTISILSTPMPFRQFVNEPANTIITQFPMVWLPAFIVPVAYTLHLLSIRQLLRRAAAEKTLPPQPVAAR